MYLLHHCLQLVKAPWRIDQRLWQDKWALNRLAVTVRQQLLAAELREARRQRKMTKRKIMLNGHETDEVVIRLGNGSFLCCNICDVYKNKEGQEILHLVEPQTGTQFRKFKEAFEVPIKKIDMAAGGAH